MCVLLLFSTIQMSGISKGVLRKSISRGAELLHACRKLLGNSFLGFQVMISCAITCEHFLGNYFSALSGNSNFNYLLRIFYCPNLSLNLTIIWRGVLFYLCPALSSSFLLLVCVLSTPSRNVDPLMSRSISFVLGSLLGLGSWSGLCMSA